MQPQQELVKKKRTKLSSKYEIARKVDASIVKILLWLVKTSTLRVHIYTLDITTPSRLRQLHDLMNKKIKYKLVTDSNSNAKIHGLILWKNRLLAGPNRLATSFFFQTFDSNLASDSGSDSIFILTFISFYQINLDMCKKVVSTIFIEYNDSRGLPTSRDQSLVTTRIPTLIQDANLDPGFQPVQVIIPQINHPWNEGLVIAYAIDGNGII